VNYRRDGIVLGLATGVFGAAFGVLAATAQLSLAKAMAMSLFVFTGASQFAAVSVAAVGGSPVSALGGALLLAARNGIYGLALSDRLRRYRWPLRLVAAQLVIDETTAMAVAQHDPDDSRRAFWVTGVAVFLCWNVGTAAGVMVGTHLADPSALGLDAAFPAGFVALLAPHLRRAPGRAAAAAGGILALCGLPLLPSGAPILLAALGVLAGVGVMRRGSGSATTEMSMEPQSS
jgi:4-azaleucine resistance transporter AzlC